MAHYVRIVLKSVYGVRYFLIMLAIILLSFSNAQYILYLFVKADTTKIYGDTLFENLV